MRTDKPKKGAAKAQETPAQVGPRPDHELLQELQRNMLARKSECLQKINFLLNEYGFTFTVQIDAQYDPGTGLTRHIVRNIDLAEKPPEIPG